MSHAAGGGSGQTTEMNMGRARIYTYICSQWREMGNWIEALRVLCGRLVINDINKRFHWTAASIQNSWSDVVLEDGSGIDFIGYFYLMCDKCRLTAEWS